jgi:hypothetical protein
MGEMSAGAERGGEFEASSLFSVQTLSIEIRAGVSSPGKFILGNFSAHIAWPHQGEEA